MSVVGYSVAAALILEAYGDCELPQRVHTQQRTRCRSHSAALDEPIMCSELTSRVLSSGSIISKYCIKNVLTKVTLSGKKTARTSYRIGAEVDDIIPSTQCRRSTGLLSRQFSKHSLVFHDWLSQVRTGSSCLHNSLDTPSSLSSVSVNYRLCADERDIFCVETNVMVLSAARR